MSRDENDQTRGTDTEALSARLLDVARQAGAEAADVLAVASESVSVTVRDGALETAERAAGVELGLRVFLGRRQACVSSSDTRAAALAAMAERAVAMAREAPEDPYCGLAEPQELARERSAAALDLTDPAPVPSPEALRERALAAEAAARDVAGVSRMDDSGAGWGLSRMHLAASNGFSGGFSRSSHWVQASAISGEGLAMQSDYAFDSRTHLADLTPAEEIGALAGQRAVAMAGARRPPTGACPVLFDERIASGLIGHLMQAANGASVARGASWLADALGTQVLPEGIDLIEDPLRPRVSGSKPFDAEGLASRRRAVVRGGVLQGWTLDLATGRKLGMESTASAARGTGAPPQPRAGSLTLTQGGQSRAALIAQMGTGLIVTSLSGRSINPTTGDYSRGASGFWVEGGEIVGPVNECTIAGNLREMLRTIVPANDARPWLSRVVPSLLVEGMTLAGA